MTVDVGVGGRRGYWSLEPSRLRRPPPAAVCSGRKQCEASLLCAKQRNVVACIGCVVLRISCKKHTRSRRASASAPAGAGRGVGDSTRRTPAKEVPPLAAHTSPHTLLRPPCALVHASLAAASCASRCDLGIILGTNGPSVCTGMRENEPSMAAPPCGNFSPWNDFDMSFPCRAVVVS